MSELFLYFLICTNHILFSIVLWLAWCYELYLLRIPNTIRDVKSTVTKEPTPTLQLMWAIRNQISSLGCTFKRTRTWQFLSFSGRLNEKKPCLLKFCLRRWRYLAQSPPEEISSFALLTVQQKITKALRGLSNCYGYPEIISWLIAFSMK